MTTQAGAAVATAIDQPAKPNALRATASRAT